MVNKMHRSLSFFVIYALVIAVQLMQVEAKPSPCNVILGSCFTDNCSKKCMDYRGNSILLSSNCNFYNLCTCEYDKPPAGRSCTVGMGLCTDICGESCCDGNCKGRYMNTGTGVCVHDYDLYFCKCVYLR
ncbi:unnamed protein product [Lathyrus oleraceus]|nr:defensin-like protein 183 [Pisum sativum]XP_050919682.1 defensin-like protein 183 [Pisum sativum]KAI5446013.1 hypothetical protein KIW84_014017 [Pisum sativum]KAI5446014.1 hypothetical protein KIW84_014017 [Pisum sativum]KAI5446015.1 hypothetical protein KIW84_014017 [Pisum sativum]